MANITMHEARFVKAFEEEAVVTLPGAPFRDDAVRFDPKTHKGWLKCRYCDAAVHFNTGSETIAGQHDIRGPSPHFHTNRGQTHGEECQWKFQLDEKREPSDYDDTAGFRIHLNTQGYSSEFNTGARLYYRDDNRKLVVADETLKSMRAVSIKSVGDMVAFMKGADPDRLKKSRVIHNGWDLSWNEFMVRYNRNPAGQENSFMALVNSMKARGQTMRPVLMEFNVESGVWPRDFFTKPEPVKSKEVEWQASPNSLRHVFRPRAYLDNRDHTGVSCAFAQAGKYLLMGYARLKTASYQTCDIHYLNISLTDPGQILKIDLADIAASMPKKFPKPAP